MKSRMGLLLVALLLLLSTAACRAESPLAEKPLAEIMDALYERATAEYGFAPTWNLELIDIPITPPTRASNSIPYSIVDADPS